MRSDAFTSYVRVRRWGHLEWIMACLRGDCLEFSWWPTHAAAMAAADAHVHMHETVGEASS